MNATPTKQTSHVIAMIVVLSMGLSLSTAATAQCENTATPSCAVYTKCFSKYCACSGDPDEYFQTYGRRYCDRFLAIADFSASGQKWRDSTLRCLQERIVPKLDISANPKCDCAQMKSFAYQSHVSCYTQSSNSICDLPLADVTRIGKTVDAADLFTSEGWKQMKDVADICKTKAPDAGRRTLWQAMAVLLSTR